MRRGDIDQMAAMFYILEHNFQTIAGERVRVVTKGQLLVASVASCSQMNGAIVDVDQAIKAAAADAHAAGLRAGIRQGRATAKTPIASSADETFVRGKSAEFKRTQNPGIHNRKTLFT
jgi:hypothetical protein